MQTEAIGPLDPDLHAPEAVAKRLQQACQRRGEMSLFRHDKMSHVLRVKVSRFGYDERLERGWLPRSSLAFLLFDHGIYDTGLALAFEPVTLPLDVDRRRVV